MRSRRAMSTAVLVAGCLTISLGVGIGRADAFTLRPVPAPPGSGSFGQNLTVLANGNYVIADPDWDSPTATNAGAVHLYNGATNQLISTLTGSHANDQVGSNGVVEVGTSNFVVGSAAWNVDRGASTWVSGTTGLNATVSATNSLVGDSEGDAVGVVTVVLTNGGYLAVDPLWDNGASTSAGAVTWGSGNGGRVGVVSASNSLVGSSADDGVGATPIALLSNGGYVVPTPSWDAGAVANVGAATWGAGTSGVAGAISAANSLVGTAAGDQVGIGGVTALANGNYVVSSYEWASGGATEAGAVTWGNGVTGVTGTVSSANSLVGETSADRVGTVTALTNGNFAVSASNWSVPAGNTAVGAVVLGNGATGAPTGTMSSAAKLTGSTNDDQVGLTVVPLFDGSYVVGSQIWRNGAVAGAGAATWQSGTSAVSASVDATNSLVGTQLNDGVGASITGLTGGRFVVASPSWDDGATADAGAVTWSDGASVVGPVSTGNSMYGAAGDFVGNSVTALTNGNYVVTSPNWTDPAGPTASVGAVTWVSGAVAAAGPVTAANSLIGSVANDQVGSNGAIALTNGNAVVQSTAWRSFTGAVTWIDGTSGRTGVVDASNSLIGSTAGDRIGREGITELTDGNYVVSSNSWHNGGSADAGAVTWGSGTAGVSGTVSATNSLIGSHNGDQVAGPVFTFPGGRYVVSSDLWDNGAIANAGAATYGPPGGVVGPITSANSVLGNQSNTSFTVGRRLTGDNSFLLGNVKSGTTLLQLEDITAPVIAAHVDLTAQAPPGAGGIAVAYDLPQAVDGHGPVSVGCTPPSGSVFPVGVTTVTCTATDAVALTASTSFTVTVSSAADFVPLAPARLADTRAGFATVDGQFAGIGKLGGNGTLELTVAGRGGVAGDAAAAALNVTVTGADGAGYVTVYPCGAERPTASNLNYVAGATVPNAVIAKIGDGGRVCIFVSVAADVIVDVNGAFPMTTSVHSINPARLLDTRPGFTTVDGQQQGVGLRAGNSVTMIRVIDRATVPADASAVVLNVTVTEAQAPGYVTVYPCGGEPPTASNLNYAKGATVANLAVSKIGASGTVCIYTQSPNHLVVDVDGYVPAVTSYVPLLPARLLDTRAGFATVDGLAAGAGIRPLGTVTSVQVTGRGGVPVGASSAVLNVTVTNPAAAGFVTVYPCGIDPPLASNLNFSAKQTVANAAIVKLGAGGTVCLFNSQATELVVDVNGYLPS